MAVRPQETTQVVEVRHPLALWKRIQRRRLVVDVLEDLCRSSGLAAREENFETEIGYRVDASFLPFRLAIAIDAIGRLTRAIVEACDERLSEKVCGALGKSFSRSAFVARGLL